MAWLFWNWNPPSPIPYQDKKKLWFGTPFSSPLAQLSMSKIVSLILQMMEFEVASALDLLATRRSPFFPYPTRSRNTGTIFMMIRTWPHPEGYLLSLQTLCVRILI